MVRTAKRVYLIGNGGSFANAQHIQNDLEMCGIRAHTLNPASLTATANDVEYQYIFSRWIILHGEPTDLLIALSGSGTSKNIVNAVQAAKVIGMAVWTEYGYAQGLTMQQAEERQVWLGHQLLKALKPT